MANHDDYLSGVRAAIENLDLDPIKVKLMYDIDGPGWSRSQVDEADLAYRRFLFITAKYPAATIVPSKFVDKVWHTHILDTEKYLSDCNLVFGRMLHHFPYLGMRGGQDARDLEIAYAATERLFTLEFGCNQTQLGHYLSPSASGSSICGGNGDCSGDTAQSRPGNIRPHLSSQTGHVSIF
jgi:hypothetical protein